MSEGATALRMLALDDSILAAKLDERLRPSALAQRDVMPFATYEVISADADEALDGDMHHQTDRIQFDVYAAEADESRAIARRLRGVLLDAYGTLPADYASIDVPDPPNVHIDGVTTAAMLRDMPPESPTDGNDSWRYRCSFDLLVSYSTLPL